MSPVVSPQAKPRSLRTTGVASQELLGKNNFTNTKSYCSDCKLCKVSSWGSTTG